MKIEEAIVGQRVRSLRAFSRVPAGSEGVIDEDYGMGVMVAWDLPDQPIPKGWKFNPDKPSSVLSPGTPLRDGFDKAFDLQFLEMVEPKIGVSLRSRVVDVHPETLDGETVTAFTIIAYCRDSRTSAMLAEAFRHCRDIEITVGEG